MAADLSEPTDFRFGEFTVQVHPLYPGNHNGRCYILEHVVASGLPVEAFDQLPLRDAVCKSCRHEMIPLRNHWPPVHFSKPCEHGVIIVTQGFPLDTFDFQNFFRDFSAAEIPT